MNNHSKNNSREIHPLRKSLNESGKNSTSKSVYAIDDTIVEDEDSDLESDIEKLKHQKLREKIQSNQKFLVNNSPERPRSIHIENSAISSGSKSFIEQDVWKDPFRDNKKSNNVTYSNPSPFDDIVDKTEKSVSNSYSFLHSNYNIFFS